MDNPNLAAARSLGRSLVLAALILVLGAFLWAHVYLGDPHSPGSPGVPGVMGINIPTQYTVLLQTPNDIRLAPVDLNFRPAVGSPLNVHLDPVHLQSDNGTAK